MAYYIVENFNSGLDLRRSMEVAPAGSLRSLKNAVINEGGEIEKRKAFKLHDDLTSYCQLGDYKGRITGPHPVPGEPGHAYFRHRFNSLPGSPFAAGAGAMAEYIDAGSGLNKMRFWAMKSTTALTNFGALLHTASHSEFAADAYVVEKYIQNPSNEYTEEHHSITFTGGEPTGESVVAANADRSYQITLGGKGYVINANILYASATNDPTTMTGTGSGNLNLSSQGQPIGKALTLGEYFGQLAIAGRRGVQFYTVDPDFALTQYQRTVTASVFAPRSLTGYAAGDLIYLARNGIRSLQARDSSNLAAVADVGSPIDKLLKSELKYRDGDDEYIFTPVSPTLPLSDFFNLAKGVVHPETGDFWLFLKEKVFVLSRRSGAGGAAWSQFDLPPVTSGHSSTTAGPLKSRWCADAAQVGETIVVRNFADEIFIYGGETSEEYDDATVEVITPFMDMGRPGTNKYFNGLDIVCDGVWSVEFAIAPEDEDGDVIWEVAGIYDGSSRGQSRPWFEAQATQIALRLTSKSKSAATLGQITIYYDGGEDK